MKSYRSNKMLLFASLGLLCSDLSTSSLSLFLSAQAVREKIKTIYILRTARSSFAGERTGQLAGQLGAAINWPANAKPF